MLSKCIRLFLCFFFLLLQMASAQLKCKIYHYSTEDGLSHNAVSCFIKDHEGFMWFGTWVGLNRFDGHNFVSYRSKAGDRSELTNNRIDQIVDGQGSILWLRAYNDQIYRFDKKTEQFEPLASSLHPAFGKEIRFNKILSATQNTLWVQTQQSGLIFFPKVDVDLRQYDIFSIDKPARFKLPSNQINFFHECKDGIWVGTESGLTLLQKDKQGRYYTKDTKYPGISFTGIAENVGNVYFTTTSGELVVFNRAHQNYLRRKFSNDRINGICLSRKPGQGYLTTASGELIRVDLKSLTGSTFHYSSHEPLLSMFEDRRGDLWIEPQKKGVVKFSPSNNSFRLFSQRNDADYNFIGNHFKAFEDNRGLLWISMKGGGFGYYDDQTDNIEYFYNGTNPLAHQFSNIVVSLYYDPAGILWFTTDERGLEKVAFQTNDFNQHLLVPTSYLKSDNEVRGLCADTRGRLWLGLKSGKLVVNQDGRALNNLFINEPAGGLGLVYSVLQDKKGNIWLATKANGLFKATPVNADETKYRLSHYLPDANDPYSISSRQIYSILEDKSGRIWLGAFDGGLNLLEQNGSAIKFIHNRDGLRNYPANKFNKVRHLASDKSGNIWIGTTDGLLILSSGEINGAFKVKTYTKVAGDNASLGQNDVQFILKGSDNQMWVGTAGGGLDRALGADPFNGLRFRTYTTTDGLSNDCITSCVEDSRGNLWIATQMGLSRFNPQTQNFRNYNSSDGLPKSGFSEAAAALLKNGELVFGMQRGYLSFNPDKIADQRIVSNLVFTNLRINNRDVSIGSNSLIHQNINNIQQLTLKYDQNTVSLDYTTLDYRGNHNPDYCYRLQGFDTQWHSNKDQRRATYTNLPPGNYRFQVKSVSRELYANTPERSLDITILPPPWRAWWAYLIYGIVTLIIAEAIRRNAAMMLKLREKIAVEQKMAELKNSFFTNISHELRTPLTLILNPIEEVLKKEQLSANGIQYVDVIRRNATRMVRFINQLLDLRKAESGKLELKVAQIEIVAFVKNMAGYFAQATKEKSITVSVESDVNCLPVWADAEKLDTVIYNVLANAVKFSSRGMEIRLKITALKESGAVAIEVIDQGPGVNEHEITDIFELYYEGENKSTGGVKGTGIGLALAKQLIELHGGSITARNNTSKGLAIRMVLKTGKDHLRALNAEFTDVVDVPVIFEKAVQELLLPPADNLVPQRNDPGRPVLLLVEDNADLRFFLAAQLSESYTVHTAGDGVEGLQKACTLIPDLILSDVMMPKMTGIEMLDKLRNDVKTSHIPVVILSAKYSIESQIEGLKYGADYYVTKPFDNQFLHEAIKNLLVQRKRLFNRFVDNKARIELSQEEVIITDRDEEFLKKVIKIIEDSLRDINFNIETVAEKVGVGRSTFFKKVKSLTGMAPVEVVRDIRVQKGKQMLDAGETNISTVAYAVGFNTAKYFSTCFKEKYHISPSEYIKNHPACSK